METRRDMPDEVKNEIMPDGKKRVITEKLPEKYLKEMQEFKLKKAKIVRQFLQVSVQIVNAQQEQKNMLEKTKDIDKKLGNIVENSFKKLKLNKDKQRNWSFKVDSFVGVYAPARPNKPKQEKK